MSSGKGKEFSVYVHHITRAVKADGSFWPDAMKSRNGTIQSKLCCTDPHSSAPPQAWHTTVPHKLLKRDRGLAVWLFCNKTCKSELWSRGTFESGDHPIHMRLDREHPPPACFTSSTAQIRSTLCTQTSLCSTCGCHTAPSGKPCNSWLLCMWYSPATTLWAPVFSLHWGAGGRCLITNGREYLGIVHPLWNILGFFSKIRSIQSRSKRLAWIYKELLLLQPEPTLGEACSTNREESRPESGWRKEEVGNGISQFPRT